MTVAKLLTLTRARLRLLSLFLILTVLPIPDAGAVRAAAEAPRRALTVPVTVRELGLVKLRQLGIAVDERPGGHGAGMPPERPLRAIPTPSGAEPPYPLNHTLDGESRLVGTPPTNHTLSAPPLDAGSPANADFESGELTGWTASGGSVTTEFDANFGRNAEGRYARLLGGATLTSAAFTVAPTATVFTFDVGYLSTGWYSALAVYVLTGSDYTEETKIFEASCSQCGSWQTISRDAMAYRGQSVKLKFVQSEDVLGLDNVRAGIDLPGYTTGGNVYRVLEADGNAYARAEYRASLTTDAFAVDGEAQFVTLRLKGEDPLASQYAVDVLWGSGFLSSTRAVAWGTNVGPAWQTTRIPIGEWRGQTIKLQVFNAFGNGVGIDDVGLTESVLPGWGVDADSGPIAAGEDANGTYVTPAGGPLKIRSSVISAPKPTFFALSLDADGSQFWVHWVDLAGNVSPPLMYDSPQGRGYHTRYVRLDGAPGVKGAFRIVLNGGKLYSFGDNLARQQLAEPFAQKVGLKIDTATGGFGYEDADLRTEGSLPLVFARYYTGHADRYGPLGYRWSHSFDTRLVFETISQFEQYVGVVFGSGREAFYRDSSGAYTAVDSRVKDTLGLRPSGGYIFTTTGNLGYQFNATGRLTAINDLNGNAIALSYDGNGRLTTVTAPATRTLTLAYDAQGRLASVTDPVGARVSYSYGITTGDLISVTGPLTDAVRTYTYDRHRLTRAVDANGQTLFTNTLDSVNRVTGQTDALSKTISLSYATPGKGATRVTDPNGHAATYYFDEWQRTTDKVDPQSRVLSYVYDGQGNVQKVIDPAFNQWQFAWDGGGNLTGATDPLNQPLQLTYDPKHLPTTVTDALSNTTRLEYDSRGNLIRKTDPLSQTWSYTYDERGNQLSETNPLGQTTTYGYDPANNRIRKTDPLSNTWTWSYDAAGKVLDETDPLGNTTRNIYDLAGRRIAQQDALGQQTFSLYSPSGYLLLEIDPLGVQTHYGYDSRGLLVTHTVGVTNTDPVGKTTVYTYDDNRNLIAERDPLGNVTSYGYDANNRVIAITTTVGAQVNVTGYTYDAAGRMTAERDPLGRTTVYAYNAAGKVSAVTATNGVATTYLYDPNGNLTELRQPLGRTTRYTYDALNRLTSAADALNQTTRYEYDAASRLITTTNALGGKTINSYDAAGHLIGVTNPAGETTRYAYDRAERTIALTDPLSRTTGYAYDPIGRRVAVTNGLGLATTTRYDPLGRVTRVTSPSGRATDYAYDPLGLLTSVVDPLGRETRYTYDAAGRQTSKRDPRGNVESYGNDALGRQVSITDALSGTVTSTYDAVGQETALTNARGKTTQTTYDALGNVERETDPIGRSSLSQYDSLGQLTRITDARGMAADYSYDLLGRITRIAYPMGSVSYGYDALGRRVAMTDSTGVTTWTYDAASRVTGVSSPQGTISYTYNSAGQRASMTLPGTPARTVTYGYDAAGRLALLRDWQGREIGFGYDLDGNRTVITRSNGVTTTRGFDAAGQLVAITHQAPNGSILQSHAYELDAAGNRVAVTTTTSLTSTPQIERYTLDALNRITSVRYANGDTVSYTYDANGNRLTKTVNGLTTTSTYDDADQLTLEGSVTYQYDQNGNLTRAGGDTYAYDWANRLVSATVGTATSTYRYDGDGVRVGKTVSGALTVNYLWDRETGLPLLVDDGANTYLHADGVQGQIDRAGNATYFLTDGLGSVRGLASSMGALVGTADYDVFGAVRSRTGASSVFGFAGEQHDPETGFVYLRARYHNPATGRFLSRDTIRPNAPGTQGFNPYAYVANNPTTWADPSGHNPAGVGVLVLGGVVTLELATAIALGAITVLTLACLLTTGCREGLYDAYDRMRQGGLSALGGTLEYVFTLLSCVLNRDCYRAEERAATSIAVGNGGGGSRDRDKDREECLRRVIGKETVVYVGFDKDSGEIVYVGRTEQSVIARWKQHESNDVARRKEGKQPRNMYILPFTGRLHPGVAAAIERQAYQYLLGRGYQLRNEIAPSRYSDAPRYCDPYFEEKAIELRAQWQAVLWFMEANPKFWKGVAERGLLHGDFSRWIGI